MVKKFNFRRGSFVSLQNSFSFPEHEYSKINFILEGVHGTSHIKTADSPGVGELGTRPMLLNIFLQLMGKKLSDKDGREGLGAVVASGLEGF